MATYGFGALCCRPLSHHHGRLAATYERSMPNREQRTLLQSALHQGKNVKFNIDTSKIVANKAGTK